MRVLLVKTSSMGDLIHTLPAISDAQKAVDRITFDWVADKPFAEIPSWHTAVDNIIETNWKQWRKHWWHYLKNGELKRFYRQLTTRHYDYVLDAQLSTKSAAITRLAKGDKHGADRRSTREPLAAKAYSHRHRVIYEQHAITRIRKLFAQALAYDYQASQPDYGIDSARLQTLPIQLPRHYVVFVHNASWSTKSWPLHYWRALAHWVIEQHYDIVLPWGNNDEYQQAKAIADINPDSICILPKLNLSQQGTVLVRAQAAVSCDTGLAHLAAALAVPNITLYGPTNPMLIGTQGRNQTHLQAELACAPCYQRFCTYPYQSSAQPACFTTIPPAAVQSSLAPLL
jgi:heptosyltransferase-1